MIDVGGWWAHYIVENFAKVTSSYIFTLFVTDGFSCASVTHTHTHTHTHTAAAAERALQFNMFCETLAGVGKMEMERHKGSGEMSIENWIHNLISLTSAQNVAFLFVARQGEEEESCSQFGTDLSKFNSRRTHTQQQLFFLIFKKPSILAGGGEMMIFFISPE